MPRVEFYPLWSQHEVNVVVVFVSPVLQNFSEIELADDLMSGDEGVHISLETKLSINRFLIKLYLNEAIRVCSDDKVDLGPIDHDYLFDVVDNIRQLSLVDLIHGPIILTRLEVTVENLVLMQPFGFEDLIMCNFVWIIVTQVW
jgi:hypothetical protein